MTDPRDLYEATKDIPIHPLCDDHGTILIGALVEAGCRPFLQELQEDPDVIVDQGLDLIRRIQEAGDTSNFSPYQVQQFATPTNFQPMLMATVHILMLGLQGGCLADRCMICQLNALRTEDGRCKCDNPDCEAKAPGSVGPFEDYLHFIAQRQGEWARENGLIA